MRALVVSSAAVAAGSVGLVAGLVFGRGRWVGLAVTTSLALPPPPTHTFSLHPARRGGPNIKKYLNGNHKWLNSQVSVRALQW